MPCVHTYTVRSHDAESCMRQASKHQPSTCYRRGGKRLKQQLREHAHVVDIPGRGKMMPLLSRTDEHVQKRRKLACNT